MLFSTFRLVAVVVIVIYLHIPSLSEPQYMKLSRLYITVSEPSCNNKDGKRMLLLLMLTIHEVVKTVDLLRWFFQVCNKLKQPVNACVTVSLYFLLVKNVHWLWLWKQRRMIVDVESIHRDRTAIDDVEPVLVILDHFVTQKRCTVCRIGWTTGLKYHLSTTWDTDRRAEGALGKI